MWPVLGVGVWPVLGVEVLLAQGVESSGAVVWPVQGAGSLTLASE